MLFNSYENPATTTIPLVPLRMYCRDMALSHFDLFVLYDEGRAKQLRPYRSRVLRSLRAGPGRSSPGVSMSGAASEHPMLASSPPAVHSAVHSAVPTAGQTGTKAAMVQPAPRASSTTGPAGTAAADMAAAAAAADMAAASGQHPRHDIQTVSSLGLPQTQQQTRPCVPGSGARIQNMVSDASDLSLDLSLDETPTWDANRHTLNTLGASPPGEPPRPARPAPAAVSCGLLDLDSNPDLDLDPGSSSSDPISMVLNSLPKVIATRTPADDKEQRSSVLEGPLGVNLDEIYAMTMDADSQGGSLSGAGRPKANAAAGAGQAHGDQNCGTARSAGTGSSSACGTCSTARRYRRKSQYDVLMEQHRMWLHPQDWFRRFGSSGSSGLDNIWDDDFQN